MTEILIKKADLSTARNEGNVIVITGTDPQTSERVTFAGDARVMVDLVDGVAFEGSATALVEPWQILGVSA